MNKEIANINMVEIWDKFRQEDDAAFSTLFETYLDPLYRYGRKFVADENFVKDCVQDLFVKLYNNRTSLSPTTNPKFYLLLSLKNMIIDALAKTWRLTYISPEDLPFLATVYHNTEDESPDGEEEEEEEIKQKFNEVLSMLNERQKEAIYLRFQLGLSYEEISELLGINYQSARNLIHRSITKIRSAMQPHSFLLLFLLRYL